MSNGLYQDGWSGYRLIVTVFSTLCLCSCNNKSAIKAKEDAHMAEVKFNRNSSIYADIVPNNSIIKHDSGDTSKTMFYAVKVGFVDSANYEQKKKIERQKYLDYEMQKNWTVLSNADSIKPVFFQPVTSRSAFLYEGIMVFEMPKGSVPDTLIYKDPFDAVDKKIFILNSKIN